MVSRSIMDSRAAGLGVHARLIESTTSSVSTRSGPACGLHRWLYRPLTVLVLVGMGEWWRRPFARSSPRFLPVDPRHVKPTSRRRRTLVCSTMAGIPRVGAPRAKQQGRPCPGDRRAAEGADRPCTLKIPQRHDHVRGGSSRRKVSEYAGPSNAPERKIHEHQADVHQAVRDRSPA